MSIGNGKKPKPIRINEQQFHEDLLQGRKRYVLVIKNVQCKTDDYDKKYVRLDFPNLLSLYVYVEDIVAYPTISDAVRSSDWESLVPFAKTRALAQMSMERIHSSVKERKKGSYVVWVLSVNAVTLGQPENSAIDIVSAN